MPKKQYDKRNNSESTQSCIFLSDTLLCFVLTFLNFFVFVLFCLLVHFHPAV